MTKEELEILEDVFRTPYSRLVEMDDFVKFPKGATIFLSGMVHCPYTLTLTPKRVFVDMKMDNFQKMQFDKILPTFNWKMI